MNKRDLLNADIELEQKQNTSTKVLLKLEAAKVDALELDKQGKQDLFQDKVESVLKAHKKMSAERANILFENIAKMEKWTPRSARESHTGLNEKEINKAASIIFEYDTMQESVPALYDFIEVAGKREYSNTTLNRSVSESKYRKVYFARVPAGRKTCMFCIMLASRGFVYATKKTAGGDFADHYHAHCNCRIVSSITGEFEGYNPKPYYQAYLNARKSIEYTVNGRSTLRLQYEKMPEDYKEKYAYHAFVTRSIIKEMRRRDVNWVNTGKAPAIEYAKNLSEHDKKLIHKHELRAVEILSKNGIKCVFQKDYFEYKNKEGLIQQIGKCDLENGIELKSLQGSSINAIQRQIKKANKKADLSTLVLDNMQGKMDDKTFISEAFSRSKEFKGDWFYVITKDEKLLSIK